VKVELYRGRWLAPVSWAMDLFLKKGAGEVCRLMVESEGRNVIS
jgi:hypothetical protein